MAQPIFLAIEVVTFVSIVYKLGNWTGKRFSIFTPNSGSIYFKILNVIVAMSCFLATYLVINEALHLVEPLGTLVYFNQAAEVTVLLQVVFIVAAIFSGKGMHKLLFGRDKHHVLVRPAKYQFSDKNHILYIYSEINI